MSFSSLSSLWCPLVTLSRISATLLRCGLLSRACNVTLILHQFCKLNILHVEIVKNFRHYVPSQWLIEIIWVQIYNVKKKFKTYHKPILKIFQRSNCTLARSRVDWMQMVWWTMAVLSVVVHQTSVEKASLYHTLGPLF